MNTDLTFRDISKVLYRHKRKCILFFLLAMSTVTGLTLIWPKAYRSYGKLFVKMGRENVMLDPTATVGEASRITVPQQRETEINTVVEILNSRMLVEKVVDSIGPDAVLGPPEEEPQSEEKPTNKSVEWLKAQAGMVPVERKEKAVLKVLSSLSSEGVRRSNVVSLHYESEDATKSQRILDEIIQTYLKEHIRLNRTPGANEFLVQQTAELREKLTIAEEKLRKTQEETGLFSPVEQRTEAVNRIARLEDQLLNASAGIAAARGEILGLDEKLSTTPKTNVTTTTGLGHAATDSMRARLFELELTEKQLLTELHPSHFRVQQVQEQLKAARKALASQSSDRASQVEQTSEIYQALEMDLSKKAPMIASLEQKISILQQQIKDEKDNLANISKNQLKLGELEREVNLLDNNYRTYLTNLEQTRIDEELEKQRISNISVIQPASLNRKPVSPQLFMNVLLGFIFAATGSMGLALACEFFDHTLKSPEDIEKQLEIPTLGAVPQLRRRELILTSRN